ncbi:MAG: WYL domain-containing protein [Deltaproteobacteria bacterium]|jgi:predicted DNA-binding transcriptional regulator YafY|nr:WYL domain-containing protein [Deltaproteobacteria bacterium]
MAYDGENYGQFLTMMELVMWLQTTSVGVSLGDIEEKFQVSRRTAERMRNAVANFFGGDFVICDRDGPTKHYRLTTRRMDPVILSSVTNDELAAFPAAIAALKKLNLPTQAANLASAGEKLKSLVHLRQAATNDLEDLMKYEGYASRPGPELKYDQNIVKTIREAVLRLRLVKIKYDYWGSELDLTLIPLGILYGERRHYFVARYQKSEPDEIRHFTIDKIMEATILDQDFEEDKNFDLKDYAAKSFGAFHEPPVDVEWLFDEEAAKDADKFIFHPGQEKKLNPNGSLTVKFRCGGLVEMAWHLYTWGKHVKVVKPKNFWKKVQKIMDDI